MPQKDKRFARKLIERLDKLDNASLQVYMQHLMNEKGFLESIFNTIREAIIVIDGDLRLRFVNSAAKPLLGIDTEDIGQSIEKFFRQLPWNEIIPRNARMPSSSRREVEIFYPEHRFLSFYIMPVANSAASGDLPEMPKATLIFQDMTENVQANELNIETQKIKAITQLSAGVAHELGNPLNSLGIHLQLLKRQLNKLNAPEKPLELLETAQAEIKRLDTIVKNFLNAVRPAPLKPVPINLPDLLTHAAKFMQNELQDRNITLQLDLQTTTPTIFGDPDPLIQAFFNIIKNAIQAMPDGGTLFIASNADDTYVHLKFIDTGTGITDEAMRRILDPYFTTKSTGSGLGLIIVDRIVRAHGGLLTIEGEPGKGSAFTISLPLHTRQTRLLKN